MKDYKIFQILLAVLQEFLSAYSEYCWQYCRNFCLPVLNIVCSIAGIFVCLFQILLAILQEFFCASWQYWSNLCVLPTAYFFCLCFQNSWFLRIRKIIAGVSRFKSGNALCHLAQNILSSSLLSNDIRIEIYRSISLPVVFMGVKFGHSH